MSVINIFSQNYYKKWQEDERVAFEGSGEAKEESRFIGVSFSPKINSKEHDGSRDDVELTPDIG